MFLIFWKKDGCLRTNNFLINTKIGNGLNKRVVREFFCHTFFFNSICRVIIQKLSKKIGPLKKFLAEQIACKGGKRWLIVLDFFFHIWVCLFWPQFQPETVLVRLTFVIHDRSVLISANEIFQNLDSKINACLHIILRCYHKQWEGFELTLNWHVEIISSIVRVR